MNGWGCVWYQITFLHWEGNWSKQGGISQEISGKCVSDKGTIQCKDPRVGAYLLCEVKQGGRVAGIDWAKKRVINILVREVMVADK